MAYAIFINRLWQTERSTIAEFNISGSNISGFILECPGPDTRTSNLRKRIPEGIYKMRWHQSGRFSRHNPLPLVFNSTLPASRYILIHPGNGPDDTDGCLLPGAIRMQDRVGNSMIKFQEIKSFIEAQGIQNFIVSIRSCYVNCPR